MDIFINYSGKELEPINVPLTSDLLRTNTNKDFETMWQLEDAVCPGFIKHTRIRDGFNLFQMNYCPEDRFSIAIDHKRPVFGFGYCISGKMTGTVQGYDQTIYNGSGDCCLTYFAAREGMVEDAIGQTKRLVNIIIEPESLLELIGDGFKELSDRFRHVVRGNKTCQLNGERNLITTPMASVLEDIYNCKYEGPIRKLFLESKSMELITLLLHETLAYGAENKYPEISTTDLRKIYEASDLLCRDLENPPSLFEVAGSVGLSHTRLNLYFKRVFDTTVFGYLRKRRLDQAKWLIEGQAKNVTNAAYSVGYNSLSSFSRAFRSQFGMNPVKCLTKNRTN